MLKHLKKNWLQCCLIILFGLLAALFSIFQGIMLQLIVDTAVGNINWDFRFIFILVIVYSIMYFIVMISYKNNLYSVITKVIQRIKDQMISAIINSDTIHCEKATDFLSTIEKDMTLVFDKYFFSFFSVIHLCILFLLALTYLLYIDNTLAAVVLISGSMSVILPQIFISKTRKVNEIYLLKNKVFFNTIKEVINGLSVIKIYSLENKLVKRACETNAQLERAHKEQLDQQTLIECVSNAIGFLVLACNVVFAGYLSYQGYFTIGTVLAVMQVMNFVMMPLVQIPIHVMQMKSAKPAISNINTYIECSPQIQTEQAPLLKNIELIQLSGVGYKLPDKEEFLLKDININFEKGKKYAVVGLSGSGKSTLLKLIAGFIMNYDGDILINGENSLSHYPSSLWRKNIAFIEQNIFLFDHTVKYNVCFNENQTDSELQDLITKVGLQEFIEKRNDGLNSTIGECGNRISGGEKQRIAIARSLYKKASILLADEPTTGLDATNTFLIEKILIDCEQLVIHVTHKLEKEILIQYDKIICLKSGEVKDQGDFESLYNRSDYFKSLYCDYNKQELSD